MLAPLRLCRRLGTTFLTIVMICTSASLNTSSAQAPLSTVPVPNVVDIIGVIQSLPAKSSESQTTLERLLDVQRQVQAIIPAVQKCTVSVERGSGFVISENGLVVTAAHVTKKAGKQVTVTFSDGISYPAITLGSNRANDTSAVQLLGPGPWPHLDIADKEELQLGQWCLSFGYPISFPRGKPSVVRLGQVTILEEGKIITDCLIMGGDSGGPLVNLDGKVIGINSGVTTNATKNVHIPVTAFVEDKPLILAGNDVNPDQPSKGNIYFGIAGETDQNRVRIRQVFKGSPAHAAGILRDDVIIQVDGEPLESFSDFLNCIGKRQPGDSVVARINRYGQLLNFEVQLKQK